MNLKPHYKIIISIIIVIILLSSLIVYYNDVTSILSVIALSMLADDGAHVLPETCHVFTTSPNNPFDTDGLILPVGFESNAMGG